MAPGLFSATMYQITSEEHMAMTVPPTLQRNPKTDWPEAMTRLSAWMLGDGHFGYSLIVIPVAIMIIA